MDNETRERVTKINNGTVPEGYKKTKVGIVPVEWSVKRLNNYLYVNKEKNVDLKYKKDEVFSISGEYGIVNQIEFMGRSYAGVSVAPYRIVYPENIVYTKSPLKANPYGIIKSNQTGKTGIVSTLYAVYYCKDTVLSKYVEYYFGLDITLNNYLLPLVNIGSKHDMKISDENVLSGFIVFPPLSEQQKIAEILSTQDKLIALKQKLIDQKKQQKKWLMQQLLTGKIRLDGFDGEWKRVKLREICDTFSGGTPSRSHPEYFNGSIKWIKSGELNKSYIYDTEETITELGLENSSAKIVEENTLLIAMYGATAGVIAFTKIKAAINQAILALIPKDELDTFYLKNTIENQIQIAVTKLTQGGQPNFNSSIIGSFDVLLPSIEEQTAIAEILSQQDREIALLEQELALQKQKKKALMQLLLTGKVRVKP